MFQEIVDVDDECVVIEVLLMKKDIDKTGHVTKDIDETGHVTIGHRHASHVVLSMRTAVHDLSLSDL
ncbi:hypothetical protein Tco_1225604, partial [Tanacetum coccineum]